mmetsp:Transcript_88117/g.161105  ORF Transcript_88117/g.161105 Transcript_88117/m.161105 type:complete len:204 (+) Transcript_88117:2842-3453(+)
MDCSRLVGLTRHKTEGFVRGVLLLGDSERPDSSALSADFARALSGLRLDSHALTERFRDLDNDLVDSALCLALKNSLGVGTSPSSSPTRTEHGSLCDTTSSHGSSPSSNQPSHRLPPERPVPSAVLGFTSSDFVSAASESSERTFRDRIPAGDLDCERGFPRGFGDSAALVSTISSCHTRGGCLMTWRICAKGNPTPLFKKLP